MSLGTTLVLVGLGAVVAFVMVEMADPTSGPLPLGLDPGTPRGGPVVQGDPGGRTGFVDWWSPRLAGTIGDPRTSGLGRWPGDVDAAPIKAYDFDGDGKKELVVHSNDTKVYVFDSVSGKALATLTTHYPPAWHIERILNAVEVARLAPGAPPTIVVANHAAYLSAWEFVPGESSAAAFKFVKKWEKRLDAFYASPGMDSKPVIADLDGDGEGEILAQTEEKGIYALRRDGTFLWKLGYGGGNSAPAAGDLDGDGKLEAVFASDAGFITVVDGASGQPEWTFDATKHGLHPASVPVTPTLAELDGQAPKEVLFTARDARHREASQYTQNHAAVFAVRQGELVWKTQPDWMNPLSYTQLIVHDVDGDGKPEVFGMDWNTIGHRPGLWERLGPAHVFALRSTGEPLWVREVDAWWSNKDLLLGDFDGDGGLDILANGPRDGHDGLWRFDAASGRPEAFLSVSPWKLQRAPIASDLWGRGTMQLVLPVQSQTASTGALLVMDTGKPWNAPWPGAPPPPG